MKKKIFALALLVSVLSFLLCSCGLFSGKVEGEGEVTVVVESTDGNYEVYKIDLSEVENKAEGAKGVVSALSEREKNPLYVEMTDSTYGAYISAIGSIKQNSVEGKYVICYTSVESDGYAGAPTLTYNSTILYQAGVGLSGMKVESGTIILFRLEKSPY